MKVDFRASRKPAVTESESRGLKARLLPSDVRTEGAMAALPAGLVLSRPQASETKPPAAPQAEPPPERPPEVRKEAGKANHQKISRRGNDHSWMDGLGRGQAGKPLTQSSRSMSLHVLCTTPSSSFWGREVCCFCDISPPNKRRQEETER